MIAIDAKFEKAMDELDEELELGWITQDEYRRAARDLAEEFKQFEHHHNTMRDR